jgi:hypothetical protein
VVARYLRLVNVHTPAAGVFAVSGFRIFGQAPGRPPDAVNDIAATRDSADSRQMQVSWSHARDAEFCIIRYGIAPDRLFNNYQVYDSDRFSINSLNTGVVYYLTVDAVNACGITRGTRVVEVK